MIGGDLKNMIAADVLPIGNDHKFMIAAAVRRILVVGINHGRRRRLYLS